MVSELRMDASKSPRSLVSSRVGVSGLAPWEFLFSCAPPCLMGDTNNLQRMMDKWLI
jgi:hypothetical protein